MLIVLPHLRYPFHATFRCLLQLNGRMEDHSNGRTWSLPFPSPCLPSGFDGPTPRFSVCCALPGTLNEASSRGTISIKKSNWSDLERAFEISERESVRRLFESAIMNARAVISDMKTICTEVRNDARCYEDNTNFRRPCRKGWVLDGDVADKSISHQF